MISFSDGHIVDWYCQPDVGSAAVDSGGPFRARKKGIYTIAANDTAVICISVRVAEPPGTSRSIS